MSVEERLRELGIELPEPPPPVGNYLGAVTVGNLVFLSGHGPRSASGEYSSGKVGGELTPEQGQEEARQVASTCWRPSEPKSEISIGCAAWSRCWAW